jgi:hypothetical protein
MCSTGPFVVPTNVGTAFDTKPKEIPTCVGMTV